MTVLGQGLRHLGDSVLGRLVYDVRLLSHFGPDCRSDYRYSTVIIWPSYCRIEKSGPRIECNTEKLGP